MFSVENWLHAIQRARTRAVLECGYTSFEVSRTGLRLIENEHGTTTAMGYRLSRSSRFDTGGCLLDRTALWLS